MIVALFILRVASLGSSLVLCGGANPDFTSTLVNCNEVGSQLPHIYITLAGLNNPGKHNDVLEFSVRVQNVKA